MRITGIVATAEIAPPRSNPIRDALQVLDGGGTVHVREVLIRPSPPDRAA